MAGRWVLGRGSDVYAGPMVDASGSVRVAVKPLDELLVGYVNPAMRAAGFRRRGRTYVVESVDRNMVLVQVRSWSTSAWVSFHVEWSPIPAVLREYHARPGGRGRLSIFSGLFHTRWTVPPDLRGGPYEATLWLLGQREQLESFGARVFDVLNADAIPRWTACLGREYLARVESDDPDALRLRLGGYGGPFWGPLWLNIDDGDPAELERLLERAESLPNSARPAAWLRARLQARLSS